MTSSSHAKSYWPLTFSHRHQPVYTRTHLMPNFPSGS